MNEPTGLRFSHVYLRGSELLPDSSRMRRRLGSELLRTHDVFYLSGFGECVRFLESKLGIKLNKLYGDARNWPQQLTNIELRDVLDLITLNFYYMSEHTTVVDEQFKPIYLQNIQTIFNEEQVSYRIDDLGGVHFAVDTEFERMRVSTIAALGGPRFDGVRTSFDAAFVALDRTPPDGKGGIRSAFSAAEGLFRLIFPKAHQLSDAEIGKHLKPLVDRLYAGQTPAIHLAQKQVASLVDWVSGAHFYRHEPGTEEPAQPPLELAVYSVSQAGGHIRWLAQLDKMRSETSG